MVPTFSFFSCVCNNGTVNDFSDEKETSSMLYCFASVLNILLTKGNNEYPLFLSFSSIILLQFSPFSERQHYRLYVISKIPTLKMLDFIKIKQSERDRAKRLASSAAGAAMEADAKIEAREAAVAISETNYDYNENNNTFEPGEGKSAEESFATQFSVEQKAKIREMVSNAASAEEIDRIESLVKRGIFPGDEQGMPPPPPPLQDEDAGVGDKRPAGEVNGGGDAKRQRAN